MFQARIEGGGSVEEGIKLDFKFIEAVEQLRRTGKMRQIVSKYVY